MKTRASSIGLLSLLSLALIGCSSGSRKLESKIVDHIEKCSGTTSCTITIGDATDFAWDKLYAFKYSTSKADRDKALGVSDGAFKELMRQLVFTKDGKVVYQESEPTNVEHPVKGEVIFDIPDTDGFKSYGKDARFAVTMRDGQDGRYYLLKQLQ